MGDVYKAAILAREASGDLQSMNLGRRPNNARNRAAVRRKLEAALSALTDVEVLGSCMTCGSTLDPEEAWTWHEGGRVVGIYCGPKCRPLPPVEGET